MVKLNMAGLPDSQKDAQQYPSKQPSESSICTYINDEDFGKAFKKLLHPIEFSSKSNQNTLLKYNFPKELHSYLVHLKDSSGEGLSLFVEAASIFTNINCIYQMIINEVYDDIMKFYKRIRNNEIYQEEMVEGEKEEILNNKKREKKMKFDSNSFEPINPQTSKTLINFDCKLVNLSKKPHPPRVQLNTNIKVNTLYKKVLPYICTGKGENIGGKYDFKMNSSLNCDFVICEEFDCATNEHKKPINPIQIVPMDDDDDEFYNEICVQNVLSLPATNPGYVKDITEIPIIFHNDNDNVNDYNVKDDNINVDNVNDDNVNDDIQWINVTRPEHDKFSDMPITENKEKNNDETTSPLPLYTIDNWCEKLQQRPTTSSHSFDPVFKHIIYKTQRAIMKEKEICNNEGIDIQDCDDRNLDVLPIPEESLNHIEVNLEPCLTFQKDVLEYNENQLQIMNEDLEMRKRVQDWHDKLQSILKKEENRLPFDIHEYESRVLNCFQSIGEQKRFKDLVEGLDTDEVARYFISVLFMVNTCNLKILTHVSEDEMILELLSKERHHEELHVNIANIFNQNSN